MPYKPHRKHRMKVVIGTFLLLVGSGGYCVFAFGGAGGLIVPSSRTRIASVVLSSGGYLTSPGSPSVP